MGGHVAGNNRGADLFGVERADLFVDRPDAGAFLVRHRGQADRTGDMVFGVFGGRPHVDQRVKAVVQQVGQRFEFDRHVRSQSRGSSGTRPPSVRV